MAKCIKHVKYEKKNKKNKEGEKGNGNKEGKTKGKTTLISTYNQSTIDDE